MPWFPCAAIKLTLNGDADYIWEWTGNCKP
jgi:hypothetical protein